MNIWEENGKSDIRGRNYEQKIILPNFLTNLNKISAKPYDYFDPKHITAN